MKKLLFTLVGLLIAANVNAATLTPRLGGTGQSSYTIGDILYASASNVLSKLGIGANGDCLKTTAGVPAWGTCGTGGGGGTDTNWSFFNGSGIRLATTTNQVLLGASATTTNAALEVRGTNGILTTGSTTLQNFTFLNATGTKATTTAFAISSIASSLLKTNSAGSIVPAVSGTDYQAAGTYVTSVGASGVVSSSGGTTPSITVTGGTNGFVLGWAGGVPTWTASTTFSTTSADYWVSLKNYLTGNQTITLTGDVTGSGATSIPATLATVNSNTGSFTNANITVNGKGLITAASNGTDLAFSTTSADYWKTQRDFYSTTSADYWKTQRDFFSTTSANYFVNSSSTIAAPAGGATGNLIQWNGSKWVSVATSTLGLGGSGGGSVTSVDMSVPTGLSISGNPITTSGTLALSLTSGYTIPLSGNLWSTTSSDYWKTQRDFYSTTSADYWKTQRDFFSTTSVNYWETTQARWATTSASYFASQGLAYSTTSQNYYNSQFKDWSIQGTGYLSPTSTNRGILVGASSTLSNLSSINSTSTNATTTNLAATTICLTGDTCRTTWPTSGSGAASTDKWATSSDNVNIKPNVGQGIVVNASSTIGAGTQAGGLTVYGGATTTGSAYIAGALGVGTNSPTEKAVISGAGGTRLVITDSSSYAAVRINTVADTTAFDFAHNNVSKWGTGLQGSSNDYRIWDASRSDLPVVSIPTGFSYFGIGTTSPFTTLSVAGSAYIGGNLVATGTASTTNLAITSITGSTQCLQVNSLGQVSGTGSACGAGGGGSTGNSKWATSTDARFIQPNGGTTIGLLIGTTTPNPFASNVFASTTAVNGFTDTNAATDKKHILVGNYDGRLQIGTSTDALTSTSTWATFDGNGFGLSVYNGPSGFGSTSPYAKLSVHANPNDFTGYLSTLFVVSSSTISATTTHFVILANGNVGVATTSPAQTFSVQGNSLTSGTSTATNFLSTNLATAAGTFVAADPTGKLIATTSPASGASNMASSTMTMFTGNGTYTVPAKCLFVKVQLTGGGGGSGSVTQTTSGSGGGGAGGYAEKVIPCSALGASVSVTVGTAGTAGSAGGNGSYGGVSSFGSFVSANGGAGSTGSSAGTTGTSGGASSIGVNGDINSASTTVAGDGWGGTVPGAGSAAPGYLFGYGSGGRGVRANSNGTAGIAGAVVVTTYYTP